MSFPGNEASLYLHEFPVVVMTSLSVFPRAGDRGQYSSAGLTLSTWNKVCIQAKDCEGDESEGLLIYFNKQSGQLFSFPRPKC